MGTYDENRRIGLKIPDDPARHRHVIFGATLGVTFEELHSAQALSLRLSVYAAANNEEFRKDVIVVYGGKTVVVNHDTPLGRARADLDTAYRRERMDKVSLRLVASNGEIHFNHGVA